MVFHLHMEYQVHMQIKVQVQVIQRRAHMHGVVHIQCPRVTRHIVHLQIRQYHQVIRTKQVQQVIV